MKKAMTALTVVGVCALLLAWFRPLPVVIVSGGSISTTRILDRNGRLLYELRRGGLKDLLPLKQIPPALVQGLIAVEDRTFYDHHGVSLRGIGRAFLKNIKAGGVREGGSTITQQLVRSSRAATGRSVVTKVHEAWLALKVDARLSKEQILEQYLNTAYFGHQAYGVSAAAKTYFGKTPSVLSIGESALLIGLLNAPDALDPYDNVPGALKRRDIVLSVLNDQGVITAEQYEDAIHEPIRLGSSRIDIQAPHFVLWLLHERPEAFVGSEIRTTIDLDLQTDAQEIVESKLALLADKNVTSAAVVVLDAHTGDILAMVGSADYFDSERDGAVNVALASRQPGSALKPFTYALAFERGFTPASTVNDTEVQYRTQQGDPYLPRNYDYDEHGLVRLREALANSYNIAAVRMLENVGVQSLLSLLKAAGITTLNETPEHYGLALTLGDGEVKLLELTSAFGVFARGGKTLRPKSMLSDPIVAGEEIMDSRIAWLIADILSDPLARLPQFSGDGPLNFDVPVAAKTGTTRNSRDNWTIGFTGDRIVGVWVGNADNSPMRGTSGITGAAPIFHDVLLAAIRSLPTSSFPKPDGIVDRTICRLSGKLPSALCTDVLAEHFVEGTEPTQNDDMYQSIPIDSRNNLLATTSCPRSVIEERVFTVFPLELHRWARERGFSLPPTDVSPLCGGNSSTPQKEDSGRLEITLPRADASFRLDPLKPLSGQKITLEARAGSDVKEIRWFVDGQEVGSAGAPDFRMLWLPTVGSHVMEARAGESLSAVTIEVIR